MHCGDFEEMRMELSARRHPKNKDFEMTMKKFFSFYETKPLFRKCLTL
jgi:hypothetical protein